MKKKIINENQNSLVCLITVEICFSFQQDSFLKTFGPLMNR